MASGPMNNVIHHPSHRITDAGDEYWITEGSHVHLLPGIDPDDNRNFMNPRTISFPNDEFVSSFGTTLEEMREAGAV